MTTRSPKLLQKFHPTTMLMSPDSSSAEVDSRPQTTIQCGPIQMIQVPECTQSHGIPQNLKTLPQQSQHVIHVDHYSSTKKQLETGYKVQQQQPQQPQQVFHQKPSIVQQKTDEELNLGNENFSNAANFHPKFTS